MKPSTAPSFGGPRQTGWPKHTNDGSENCRDRRDDFETRTSGDESFSHLDAIFLSVGGGGENDSTCYVPSGLLIITRDPMMRVVE